MQSRYNLYTCAACGQASNRLLSRTLEPHLLGKENLCSGTNRHHLYLSHHPHPVIGQTLRFDPAVWDTLMESGMPGEIVVGIVFLGGASTLLGQSVVLFLNRVRKGRFFFSLVVNGLLYLLQFTVWGIVICVVARFLFEKDRQPAAVSCC